MLGTVLMTAAIPRAAFMLLGGAFSDRFSPRTLMLLSNVIRGIAVGILAALVLTGRAELWHLYVLAGIFGIVDAFFYPAMNTIVPMLVPERQLAPANAARPELAAGHGARRSGGRRRLHRDRRRPARPS